MIYDLRTKTGASSNLALRFLPTVLLQPPLSGQHYSSFLQNNCSVRFFKAPVDTATGLKRSKIRADRRSGCAHSLTCGP